MMTDQRNQVNIHSHGISSSITTDQRPLSKPNVSANWKQKRYEEARARSKQSLQAKQRRATFINKLSSPNVVIHQHPQQHQGGGSQSKRPMNKLSPIPIKSKVLADIKNSPVRDRTSRKTQYDTQQYQGGGQSKRPMNKLSPIPIKSKVLADIKNSPVRDRTSKKTQYDTLLANLSKPTSKSNNKENVNSLRSNKKTQYDTLLANLSKPTSKSNDKENVNSLRSNKKTQYDTLLANLSKPTSKSNDKENINVKPSKKSQYDTLLASMLKDAATKLDKESKSQNDAALKLSKDHTVNLHKENVTISKKAQLPQVIVNNVADSVEVVYEENNRTAESNIALNRKEIPKENRSSSDDDQGYKEFMNEIMREIKSDHVKVCTHQYDAL